MVTLELMESLEMRARGCNDGGGQAQEQSKSRLESCVGFCMGGRFAGQGKVGEITRIWGRRIMTVAWGDGDDEAEEGEDEPS